MKLFGFTCITLAAVRADEWELNFEGGITFDENDSGFKQFTQMSDQLASDESGLAFGIGERGKVGTSQASIEKMQLRKYETIKKMTVYLHAEEEREWGRYCPYGCHCAIDGPHNILAGGGKPLDEIDSACKRHKECIQCALQDFDQATCPWWKPYKMTAMVDDTTGEKHLVCQDQPGYCKRALCECDAQFARDLYNERQNYNRDFHHRYGNIDTDEMCKSVNRGKGYGQSGGNGGNSGTGESQCCGNYPKRFPYNESKNQCCDGKITGLGAC